MDTKYRTNNLFEVAVLRMHGVEPTRRFRDSRNRLVVEFERSLLLDQVIESIVYGQLVVNYKTLYDAYRDEMGYLRLRAIRAGTSVAISSETEPRQ